MERQAHSARELLWRYGCACIDTRYTNQELSEREYELARRAIAQGRIPPRSLLERWFPRPFAWLAQNDVPFDRPSLEHYWREVHRTAHEQTPVEVGYLIDERTQGRFWQAVLHRELLDADGCTYRKAELASVFNLHNIPLAVGDKVLVHVGIIAEAFD